jgi:hypothetical protein
MFTKINFFYGFIVFLFCIETVVENIHEFDINTTENLPRITFFEYFQNGNETTLLLLVLVPFTTCFLLSWHLLIDELY